MTRAINIIIASLCILFFSSCSDTITNQYLQPEEGGKAPDVNVTWSGYSLETVHSFHMDTTAYPEYNYCINLNLKLDKPENRNQINKMIIVNDNGTGWEFYKNQLEGFYSDTLGGYELKNLIYRGYSSSYPSQNYKVKLFSAANKKAEDYELIIIPDFISSSYISHGWYAQNIYQISFDYYQAMSLKEGKVVWLDQGKQSIGESEINSSSFADNYRMRLNNIPADAFYFYFYIEGKRENIPISFKSAPYAVEERYPSNVQIMGENISNMSLIRYIPEIQKILILDRNNNYLHVVDFATFVKEKQITFSASPYTLAYSAYNNKIYVGCQNGKVYSLSLSDNTPSFVRNLSSNAVYSMIAVNKYLIASTLDYTIKVLDLEDNSATTQSVSNTYNNLIFNKTKKVVYGLGSDGGIIRFNFNPDSGSVSDLRTNYIPSSSYSFMILFPDDSKLVLSSGYIYNCSTLRDNDLTEAGNLESVFSCGYFLNNNNSIATLFNSSYSSYPVSLNIYSAATYQQSGTNENFYGTPQYMLSDGDIIKVIESSNGKVVAEVFTYSQLVSGSISVNKSAKEKYYLSKKIN